MAEFIAKTETNLEPIPTGGSVFFFQKQKNIIVDDMNFLEIDNADAAAEIDYEFNGLASRKRRLFAKSIAAFGKDDRILFRFLKVTNRGNSAIPSGAITVNGKRVEGQNATV